MQSRCIFRKVKLIWYSKQYCLDGYWHTFCRLQYFSEVLYKIKNVDFEADNIVFWIFFYNARRKWSSFQAGEDFLGGGGTDVLFSLGFEPLPTHRFHSLYYFKISIFGWLTLFFLKATSTPNHTNFQGGVKIFKKNA